MTIYTQAVPRESENDTLGDSSDLSFKRTRLENLYIQGKSPIDDAVSVAGNRTDDDDCRRCSYDSPRASSAWRIPTPPPRRDTSAEQDRETEKE